MDAVAPIGAVEPDDEAPRTGEIGVHGGLDEPAAPERFGERGQAQERAREVANQLREQSSRAVGTMTETVEHNPLTSMAVAFAVGFLLASLIKR